MLHSHRDVLVFGHGKSCLRHVLDGKLMNVLRQPGAAGHIKIPSNISSSRRTVQK